jgi:hypothetical protein
MMIRLEKSVIRLWQRGDELSWIGTPTTETYGSTCAIYFRIRIKRLRS